MKTIKKAISFLAVAALLIGSASAAFTPEIDVNVDPQGAYRAANSYYANLYRNEYVPCYLSYNDSLDTLGALIASSEITTIEQAEAILAFLSGLVSDKHAFFGDRETPDTSRYDVPFYRNAMYDAVATDDYAGAYNHALTLMDEVGQRITCLQELQERIDTFEIPSPEEPGSVSASFTVSGSGWYYTNVVITNSTDSPISNWSFSFDYVGVITNIYADGSGLKTTIGSTHATVAPQNKNQPVYTIPAGGSVTFICQGGTAVSSVSSVKLNGNPIEIAFGA